jgi:hypothetical protein
MFEFRRITTQKRFIPQIDGLRFVAISSVVLLHIYAALERGAVPEPIPLDGDVAKRGVELFFVISGFILGVPFASRCLLGAQKVNLKQYYWRRVTRLEPPYFISLFVCAAAGYVTVHRGLSDMWPHLLASFFYLHNLIFGAFAGAVNGLAWLPGSGDTVLPSGSIACPAFCNCRCAPAPDHDFGDHASRGTSYEFALSQPALSLFNRVLPRFFPLRIFAMRSLP